MDDAGSEAARRWRAARKWADWFGLSFLAFALSLLWLLAGELALHSDEAAQVQREGSVAAAAQREAAQVQQAWEALREAERQEAARELRLPEAERQEAERQEAERQEAERREAERRLLEATQREAEAWREAARRRVEVQSPEPREGQGGRLASILTMITALGTLATGMATASNLFIAWRAERRQAQEFQFKIRQLEHQVQELDAKKREEGNRT